MFHQLLFSTRKTVQAGRHRLLRALQTALTQSGVGSNLRMLALAAICGLVFSAVFAHGIPRAFAHGIPRAFATQAAPWHSDSYYVTSTNTTTAYDHGKSQGSADASHHADSMVVLDFGGQVNGSTVDNWNAGYISNSTVEAVAEAFAHGYKVGANNSGDTTTVLTLAIGTNNSIGSGVSSSTGLAWAHVADAVQSYDQSHGYASQVFAMGGDDIEPDWGGANSWSPAEAWASGYSSDGSGILYADFGSADGCPTNSSNDAACDNGWHQYGLWYVSWGASAAVPLPEIYHDSWAYQWMEISLYGYYHQGGRTLNVWGPMSTPGYLTPVEAWDDLWNALNSNSHTAQNMTYSTEIAWTW